MIGTQYSYLPIHQNICSGGRIFLLKTTTLTLMYLLLRMKIKNEVYRLYETIPPLLTPHHRVKFINPLKAEPLLLFWQTSLKNMKMAVCTTLSNTSASPSWPTGFNSQTRKKKKKNQQIQSVDEYIYTSGPSIPREGWVTRQHHYNGPLSEKVFLFKEIN